MAAFKTALSNKLNSGQKASNRFKALCEKVSELLHSGNLQVIPYTSASLPYFQRLSLEKRLQVIKNIEIYAEILEATIDKGFDIRETKQLTWNAFKVLSLRPCSNFFTYIANDSVVEIYTSYGVQIFRNHRFFEICSYTLEDLYCRPWFELYHRDPKVIESISTHIQPILAGEQKEAFSPELIGVHYLEEKNSPYKYKIEVEIDCIAPVYDENDDVSTHFVAVETADVMNKLSAAEKEKLLEKYYAGRLELNLVDC